MQAASGEFTQEDRLGFIVTLYVGEPLRVYSFGFALVRAVWGLHEGGQCRLQMIGAFINVQGGIE